MIELCGSSRRIFFINFKNFLSFNSRIHDEIFVFLGGWRPRLRIHDRRKGSDLGTNGNHD